LGRHSIAQAAIPVLADPQLASKLGRAAWNRVQNNFLEEHFAERFRRALSSLIPAYGMGDPASRPAEKPGLQENPADAAAVYTETRS